MSNEQEYAEIMARRQAERLREVKEDYLTRVRELQAHDCWDSFSDELDRRVERIKEKCECTCKLCGCCR
jgi:hypothetical protein